MTKIQAIAPTATKQKGVPLHCRTSVYSVPHNALLNSTAATRVTECLHKYLEAQRLCVKYMYGKINVTTAARVCNVRKPPKVDDAEATVSTNVYNDAKICQPTTFRIYRDDQVPAQLRVFSDLTEDGELRISAHAA